VSVDDVRHAVVAHIEASDSGEQTCVDLHGADLWSVGRHAITVEMLDSEGEPWGPISYLHHYFVEDEGISDGYSWMTSLFLPMDAPAAPMQALIPLWDSHIDLGGLAGEDRAGDGGSCGAERAGLRAAGCDAGGNAHGVFINPSIFRVDSGATAGGGVKLEWQMLFREHELKAPGVGGYRKRQQPSAQWFARLELAKDASTANPYFRVQEGSAARLCIPTGCSPALEGARGPQDARLLKLSGGELLVWFNGNSQWRPSRVTQQFLLVPPASSLVAHAAATVEVKLSHQVYEKNFVPFEYGSDVYFAYTIEPHHIYKLDPGDGSVDLQATSSNQRLREAIGRADIWLHGGAVPIRVLRPGRGAAGPEYLSVCVQPLPEYLSVSPIQDTCLCAAAPPLLLCALARHVYWAANMALS